MNVSSGSRIRRAVDDAAGLTIADDLHASARINKQGIRNINDGISLLQVADAAIENLSEIVVRLQELAEQAANGTYSSKQRKVLNIEAQALQDEFFRITQTTSFNDKKLFTGDFDSLQIQAGVGSNTTLDLGLGGAIGTGEFKPVVNQSLGDPSPSRISSADYNLDGILDFAILATDKLYIGLGTGDGSFSINPVTTLGTSVSQAKQADINNDGILDFVTNSAGDSTLRYSLGNGDGTFQDSEIISLPVNNYAALNVSDFNGDGFADIAVTDRVDDEVRVLLGDGTGAFNESYVYDFGTEPEALTAGDFNNDGILDLAATMRSPGTLEILLGSGDGTFYFADSTSLGNLPLFMDTGDLNNDGNLDIVASSQPTDTMTVSLGNGDGTFAASVSYTVGDAPYGIHLADFNSDGFLDVIAANRDADTISLRFGQGDGTFGSEQTLTSYNQPFDITSGDFDGDGVVDFLTSSRSPGLVDKFFNKTTSGIAPIGEFSLETMADARQALAMFDKKHELLLKQRGQIGANQSRLEIARTVLQNNAQMFSAAESQIRDADIAEETSRLVRQQIIQQSAIAVLAHANLQPTTILDLLK